MQRQASLPFNIVNGHIVIVVMINGTPKHFLIDTGAFYSILSPEAAADLHMTTYDLGMNATITGIGGKEAERYTVADTLTFGQMQATHVRLFLGPTGKGEDGILGPEWLRNFDLDIDFPNKVLNLFRPHPCRDHVAYWAGRISSCP